MDQVKYTNRQAEDFNEIFNNITNKIEFNPGWANTTGYYDNAVCGEHAPKLQPGELVSSVDNAGRKIVIMGTPFKNLVVFQRYSNRDDVYATNMTNAMNSIVGRALSRPLSEGDFNYLFDIPALAVKNNLGHRLKCVMEHKTEEGDEDFEQTEL